MGYLTPEMTTPPRPEGTDNEILEVRSYLLMRVVIGLIGIALPILLVAGDFLFLDSGVANRGSLSAYYHSGMRDVFVGTLCVTGIFLITYKIFRRSLDNTLSMVAGAAALTVAFFPTGLPEGAQPTPLQSELGEGTVTFVHFTAAAIFIVMLAVLTYYFAKREGARSRHRIGHDARYPPEFWHRFHRAATGVIVFAIAFIGVTKLTGMFDDHSLFVGETLAAWAFGASWLAKGFELVEFKRRARIATPVAA